MVMDGELELGLVPARAWDALGVDTLRALHAPFLVTSDEHLDAVVADPVADDMLAGLEAAGVTGLAIAPEGPRRVFSFGEPFVAAAAFDGVTVRAPTSTTTHDALEALGATVDDFATPDGAFYDGVIDGTIAAAESSFAFADSLPGSTTATGNLVVFPKANAFVANDDAFAALDDTQRLMLVDAAIATRDWAIAGNPADADLAESFCAAGGTIVRADRAEVEAMIAATEPVHMTLAEDPTTGELLERIRAIAADVGPPAEIAPCSPATDHDVPIPPAPTVPDGTDVSLVVESQIGATTSPVSEAGGPFAGCTTVQDLDAEATEFNLDITIYSGTKQLSCPGGEVTIHYDAVADEQQPGITAGTWSIVSSTLTGAGSGGGQLNGDGRDCEPEPGSDACIVDTFTGAVAP